MNSSISNSRSSYLKICLVLFTIFTISAVLLNLIVFAHGATGFLNRVTEARLALPKIVKEEKPLVMMFGSSMTQAGFSPRLFDKLAMAEKQPIKSFNFGFGGLNPFFQDYLSRRIVEQFQSHDRRLKLAVIEFNPFQATQTRWTRALPHVDSFLTLLASDRELWEITKTNPERGALLFNIKYIRQGISAEMITSFYADEIFPPTPIEQIEEPEELRKQRQELGRELTELFDAEYPDYEDADWYYPWQGGGTIPEERSDRTIEAFKAYYQTFQHESMKQNYRQRRIHTADIEALQIEPLLIEHFINIVNQFKQISDHVEIVMLPRDAKWIQYSPDAINRLNDALQSIEQNTGLTVHNHQIIEGLNSGMFRDVTHLTRYDGDIFYTTYLFESFKNHLR